jgi:ATP synthase (E/31 kDa) subunit
LLELLLFLVVVVLCFGGEFPSVCTSSCGFVCLSFLSFLIYVSPFPAPSAGGIVLSAMKGKIICSNTLEQRLRFAYEQQLPKIREMLFEY